MHRNRLWIVSALALIVLGGLALRAWYAGAELHISRFEDEQYSLANVRKIFFLGDLEPASGYYPSPVFTLPQVALLKASDALYHKTGEGRYAVVNPEGEFLAPAFLLTRWVQVICGTLTILFVFAIGRRLFGPAAGLLGALVFAFVPWNLHASGYNKPDAMLVLGIAASFYLSLRAAEEGKKRFYLLAGVAIALTMSCKLTGGLIAVPLILATALGWRDRRRVVLLALAGATSVVTFILLNPFWPAYLGFLQGLKRDYAGRTEDSRLSIPFKVVDFLTDGQVHGTAGWLAVLAFGWLGWRLLRHYRATGVDEPPAPERQRMVMFLSFPLAYTVTYALQTAYFKPNNFLPLLPFSSLALAWLLIATWRRACRARPALRRQGVVALAVAGLAVWFFTPGFLYVYRSLIPTTWHEASSFLIYRLRPPEGRLIYSEAWRERLPRWEGARPLRYGRSGYRWIEDWTRFGDEELDLADALLYRRGRGPARRVDRVRADDVAVFAPSPFRRRGPEVVAIAHPRRQLQPTSVLEVRPCPPGEGCMVAELPAGAQPGETVTFTVWVPDELFDEVDEPPAAWFDGRPLEITWIGRSGPNHGYLSTRVRRPPGVSTLRFTRPSSPFDASSPLIGLQWTRWRDTGRSPRQRGPGDRWREIAPPPPDEREVGG